MPWEYLLAVEGYWDAQRDRHRQEAGWLAMILTAQTGHPITPAQLLGETTTAATAEKQGERRIAEIQRKLKARKKRKR